MNKYLTQHAIAKKIGIAYNSLKWRKNHNKIPKKFLKVVEKKQVLVSIKYLDWLRENETNNPTSR